MSFTILRYFALFTVLLLSATNPIAAQECDRCAFASYLQSGLQPDNDNHFGFQLDYRYREDAFSGDSEDDDALDEKVADSVFNFYYSQPLIERLSLDLYLPVISKAKTIRPNNTYSSDRETSLGDASVLLVGQPYLSVSEGDIVDWRLRAGAKLPTGDSDDLNDYSSLEDSTLGGSAVHSFDLAKGSGSVDWIVGSSFLLRHGWALAFFDAQYIGRTEGENDFRFGDRVAVHAAPGFTFARTGLNSISLMLDTSFVYNDTAEFEGEEVEDTGNVSFYMGPEAVIDIGDSFSATVGVNFPIYRDVDGRQLTASYEVLAGLMVGF